MSSSTWSSRSPRTSSEFKPTPKPKRRPSSSELRPTPKARPTAELKPTPKAKVSSRSSSWTQAEKASQADRSQKSATPPWRQAAAGRKNSQENATSSKRGNYGDDTDKEDKGYWQEDSEKEDEGDWQEDNEEEEEGYWQEDNEKEKKGYWQHDTREKDKGFWQDDDEKEEKGYWQHDTREKDKGVWQDDNEKEDDNGYWQDWKPKATYTWAKKSEKKLLPIQEKRAEVIPVICGTSRVVTLLGETGSGKSTQVPQMILAQARAANLTARVCVTQPRRVAALNLANRVATELGEYVGESVGYRIGGESKPGYNIDFCTVGYTLQLFLNSPEEFGNYTHIILDEVHERSAESDMLCLVVRLLAQHRFKHIRLVVMSATLQSDLFARYFAPISPEYPVGHVFVGARCFTVTQHFLEELPKALGKKLRSESLIMSRIKDVFGTVKPKKIDQKHCDKLHKIILELLEIIAVKGSTILVFLPGIAEISSLWQEAKEMDGNGFRIFPLHSMVPREEQELVFQEPDPDVTNVVLATDIAESSITLPHVVAVIDLGLHRRVDHDASKGIASLATKWISKAAAAQRSGRAGRTQPGLCLRLYTKEFFEKHMKEFEPPECTSMALDRLYLQAKQLSCQLGKSLEGLQVPRGAQELLAQLPEAPDLKNVVMARQKNAELGTISNATEVAKITPLGYLCLQLPLDLKLTRLVWLGAHFGLAADAVVLASVITSQDAFSMPSPLFMWEESEFVSRLRSAASARILFDGGELSEPLMQRQLFLEWLTDFHHNEYVCGDKERVLWARRRHTLSFSHQYSLSRGRMEHVVSYVVDLSLRTYRACMPNSMAAKSLSELLFALGYTIKKGDLAGIPGKEWRAFHPEEQAFEANTSYLKALMAAAFSDQLLLGGYGSIAKEIDTSGKSNRKQLEQLEALQKLMEKHDFPARETVLFGKDVKDPHEYVEHVSGNGGRSVEKEETHTLVRLSLNAQSEGARWCALASRKSAPLLVSKTRLPAEFNLLSQFQKHMQELQRVQATGWTYKPVPFIHPHILRWEWMEPLYTPKGALLRCEGMLERKNPVGLVGYVQPLEEGKLKPVACFAVAANVRGGHGPTNCYPESVTCLSPGHIAFVLSTTKLDLTRTQLRRFGFTTRGELAVLHRCVDLPSGCLYGAAWERVRLLRQALFNELQFDMPSKDTPVLYDSDVEALARELFESMPKASEEAQLSLDRDCSLSFLSNTTVNLSKEELPLGVVHEAFLPLAEWSTLVERRQALVNKINSQVKAKAAKRHPTEPLPPGRVDSGRSPRRAPRVVSPRRSRSRRRRGETVAPRHAAPRVVSPRRSRSRRSRKRQFTEAPRAPREEKVPKKPKKLKASECQLYDLVLQVLDRWRSACDDEVGDDRFKVALDAVLSSGALRREEVERVRPLLDRQVQLPPPRLRGRGSTRDLRVPTALAELEKRNKDILRVASRASTRLPREETQVPDPGVVVPPLVPMASAEPAAEPEPAEEPVEEAAEEAAEEVEVVDLEEENGEKSPGSPAEVPGLAPFTPSPNGESDEP